MIATTRCGRVGSSKGWVKAANDKEKDKGKDDSEEKFGSQVKLLPLSLFLSLFLEKGLVDSDCFHVFNPVSLGDTGYRSIPRGVKLEDEDKYPHCPAFEEIGRREGPFDFSAIPIGAFLPRDFMSRVSLTL